MNRGLVVIGMLAFAAFTAEKGYTAWMWVPAFVIAVILALGVDD